MQLNRATILATAGVIALAGCGQKGPLYLPPPQPAPQSKAPPAAEATQRTNSPFPDVPATNEKK